MFEMEVGEGVGKEVEGVGFFFSLLYFVEATD